MNKDGSTSNIFMAELQSNSKNWANVVEQIVRMERKIFPKHESLSSFFDKELKKKNSGLIYSETNEVMVGYLMYTQPSSLSASITKLAVRENFRKQGHGEALMKAAIDKCRTRKVQRVSLHVDSSNIAAISLYKKLGFRVEELVESYYSPDRSAYRMYLEFDLES
ncbi:Acyl-CoA N-acyltransferases (NAT) superfamily protein [Euphorbia peplus]|nr:Acyl-CoA N-acyltransferases (NAT) superfamily protein [Euphorbia peplus]